MSRVTTYDYSNSGLLNAISINNEVVRIIRPENKAGLLADGEGLLVEDPYTTIEKAGSNIQMLIENGNLVKEVIEPKGKITKTVYNKFNKPIKISTSTGEAMSFEYDDEGNLTKKRDEVKNTTDVFEYANKNLTSHIDAEGRVIRFEYDDKNNLVRKFYIQKGATSEKKILFEEREYDGSGLLVKVNQSGQIINMEYDTYGNLSGKTNGTEKPEQYSNDPAGNVTRKNKEASTQQYTYDLFNRVLEVDDNNDITKYVYDDLKRLTEIKLPNNESTYFKYDSQDRIIEKSDVKGQIWKYGYDDNGNIRTITKPDGRTVTYEYDQKNNPVKIITPEDVIEQLFDSNNKLVYAKNSLSEINREYDLTGLLKKEDYAINGRQPVSILYKYDKSGLCKQVKFGDKEIGYTYNDLFQITKIESGKFVLDISGKENQLPDKFVHQNFNINNEYNDHCKLISVKALQENTVQFNLGYSYDAIGNCNSKIINGKESWEMMYNNKNELVAARLSENSNVMFDKAFTYDKMGNRSKENGTSLVYDEHDYQLIEDGLFTYEYDLNGNLTKRINKIDNTSSIFGYDTFDRMVAFRKEKQNGEVLINAVYGYDALGRRIQKNVDNIQEDSPVKKWYLYNDKNILVELDDDFNVTRHYVGLNYLDGQLGFVDNDAPYYYIKGQFNTVEAILDESGKRVALYSYGPFGELIKEEGSISNNMLFIGREFDRESDLYYLRARHYDPYTGRFLQVDPDAGELLEPRTILLKYSYANNNPFSFADPTGRSFWDLVGNFFSAVGVSLLGGLGTALAIFALGGGFGGGFLVAFFAGWGALAITGWLVVGALVGALIGGIIGGLITGSWDGFWKGAQIGAIAGTFIIAIVLSVIAPPLAPVFIGGAIIIAGAASLSLALLSDRPWIVSEMLPS